MATSAHAWERSVSNSFNINILISGLLVEVGGDVYFMPGEPSYVKTGGGGKLLADRWASCGESVDGGAQ